MSAIVHFTRMNISYGCAIAKTCLRPNGCRALTVSYTHLDVYKRQKPVLGSSLLGKVVLTQDQLYYIQNWNFGGRSQLLTIPLAGGEPSSKLDREDLSYQDITLLDEDHLLVKAWMKEDKGTCLFVLDLVSGQYQPLTEPNWQECAVDGEWRCV